MSDGGTDKKLIAEEAVVESMARAGFDYTRSVLPNNRNLRVKGEFDVEWDDLAPDVRETLLAGTRAELAAALGVTLDCPECWGMKEINAAPPAPPGSTHPVMDHVWVVREPDDHGEPIVAICATWEDAMTCAGGYALEYPCSEPVVQPYALDPQWGVKAEAEG